MKILKTVSLGSNFTSSYKGIDDLGNILKFMKILETVSLGSNFTGSYKKRT